MNMSNEEFMRLVNKANNILNRINALLDEVEIRHKVSSEVKV